MAFDAKSVANFFLSLAKSEGEGISPMKLQKLVYYAHGWYAGYTGQPLINERVEAWQYGPVIPSLYHEFKHCGSGSISSLATDFVEMELEVVAAPADAGVQKFLRNVWDSYGKFTGIRLSEMTHAPGGPWEQTWKSAAGAKGVDIPFDLIAEHFQAAAAKAKQAAAAA